MNETVASFHVLLVSTTTGSKTICNAVEKANGGKNNTNDDGDDDDANNNDEEGKARDRICAH